jgi:hypothetical protein
MPQTLCDLLLAPLRIGHLELGLSPRDLAMRVLIPLALAAIAYALAMRWRRC